MESLQLALQVEVSLLLEPPGIALVITHVPFIEAATVETKTGQTRLLLTEEQATKLSEDLARRGWDLRQQSGAQGSVVGR